MLFKNQLGSADNQHRLASYVHSYRARGLRRLNSVYFLDRLHSDSVDWLIRESFGGEGEIGILFTVGLLQDREKQALLTVRKFTEVQAAN